MKTDKIVLENAEFARIGFNSLSIPLLKIGKGKPIVSIIAGTHGDETSSLLILDKLIKSLPDEINGCLNVILSANPLARMEDKRFSSFDGLDMNRIFPGNFIGAITSKCANKLIEILKDSNFVLDLHEFGMETPIMGIFVKSDKQFINEENIKLMNSFNPKQCWVIDSSKKDEKQFGKSLGSALNDLEINNIAIELNNSKVITEKEIDECVQCINRVLSAKGLIKSDKLIENKFNFFDRLEILALKEGIFIPKLKVFDLVHKGEIIGFLRTLPGFEDIQIESPIDGTIMQLSKKTFVSFGRAVAAVGKVLDVGGENDC